MEISEAQQSVHEWAESKGWNDAQITERVTDTTALEKRLANIALIHLKLSQELELLRDGKPPSAWLDNLEVGVPSLDEVDGMNVVKVLAKLALVHSEVSEAVEAVLKGQLKTTVVNGKPEGLGVELADVDIRTLHLRAMLGLDAQKDFALKMEFNRTRPEKHGKLA
jgi:NTP pyrophosphatase (non-canonical NTP hydrolase)